MLDGKGIDLAHDFRLLIGIVPSGAKGDVDFDVLQARAHPIGELIKRLVRKHGKQIELICLRQHRRQLCGRLAGEFVALINDQKVRTKEQSSTRPRYAVSD